MMLALEERVLAKVEASLADLKGGMLHSLAHVDKKVTLGVAPLLETLAQDVATVKAQLVPLTQTLAEDVLDVKARLDGGLAPLVGALAEDVLSVKSRVDGGLAPMVEALAQDLLDVKARSDKGLAPLIEELATDAIDTQSEVRALLENVEKLHAQGEETRRLCDTTSGRVAQQDVKLKGQAGKLATSVAVMVQRIKGDIDDVKNTLAGEIDTVKSTLSGLAASPSITTAVQQHQGAGGGPSPGRSPKKCSSPFSEAPTWLTKRVCSEFDIPFQGSGGAPCSPELAFSPTYSKKAFASFSQFPMSHSQSSMRGDSHGIAGPRFLERAKPSCRSLPQLPPVQALSSPVSLAHSMR